MYILILASTWIVILRLGKYRRSERRDGEQAKTNGLWVCRQQVASTPPAKKKKKKNNETIVVDDDEEQNEIGMPVQAEKSASRKRFSLLFLFFFFCVCGLLFSLHVCCILLVYCIFFPPHKFWNFDFMSLSQ